jgi:hypothetical protein
MQRPPENVLPALLGLPDETALLLDSAEVSDWGTLLTLRGHAENGAAFTLTLTGCREFLWRAFVPMDERTTASIYAFSAGRSSQRSPLKLLTNHFSIAVYYENMTCNSSP